MKNNYSLLAHNTFSIDAKARYFAAYESEEQLCEILRSYYAMNDEAVRDKNGRPRILHIGGGSNLLFLENYQGLVLHSKIKGIEVLEETADEVLVRVGSGMVWDEWVAESLQRGWYGLENLSLIPGEVGAAAVQNIGAYGSEAKDSITRVWLIDLSTMEKCSKRVEEMNYAYRYSLLKSDEWRGRYAVTYVEMRLSKHFEARIAYGGLRKAVEDRGEMLTAEMLREVIIEMRQGKLPDPKVLGNAGSFFMNPIVPRSLFEQLLQDFPEMPHYEVDDDHVKIPAGWLIEQSGWKGRSLGKAGVYERQALVLVNLGGASAGDIVRLCETVRADVMQKFGIDIHPEVNFIKN